MLIYLYSFQIDKSLHLITSIPEETGNMICEFISDFLIKNIPLNSMPSSFGVDIITSRQKPLRRMDQRIC